MITGSTGGQTFTAYLSERASVLLLVFWRIYYYCRNAFYQRVQRPLPRAHSILLLTIIVTSLIYFSSTTSIGRDGGARNSGACSDPTQGGRCNNAPLTTSSPTIDT